MVFNYIFPLDNIFQEEHEPPDLIDTRTRDTIPCSLSASCHHSHNVCDALWLVCRWLNTPTLFCTAYECSLVGMHKTRPHSLVDVISTNSVAHWHCYSLNLLNAVVRANTFLSLIIWFHCRCQAENPIHPSRPCNLQHHCSPTPRRPWIHRNQNHSTHHWPWKHQNRSGCDHLQSAPSHSHTLWLLIIWGLRFRCSSGN